MLGPNPITTGRAMCAPVLHRPRLNGLALGLVLCLLASPAAADLTGSLTLTVNGQQILGDNQAAGQIGTIVVHAVSESVHTPIDENGLIRGSEQHAPVTIRKPTDRATPLLFKAWSENELVDSAVIRLYRPDGVGAEEHYLTITLTNGRVVGMSLVSPDSVDTAGSVLPATEHVSLTYQKITWTYEPNNITYQATWGGP